MLVWTDPDKSSILAMSPVMSRSTTLFLTAKQIHFKFAHLTPSKIGLSSGFQTRRCLLGQYSFRKRGVFPPENAPHLDCHCQSPLHFTSFKWHWPINNANFRSCHRSGHLMLYSRVPYIDYSSCTCCASLLAILLSDPCSAMFALSSRDPNPLLGFFRQTVSMI